MNSNTNNNTNNNNNNNNNNIEENILQQWLHLPFPSTTYPNMVSNRFNNTIVNNNENSLSGILADYDNNINGSHKTLNNPFQSPLKAIDQHHNSHSNNNDNILANYNWRFSPAKFNNNTSSGTDITNNELSNSASEISLDNHSINLIKLLQQTKSNNQQQHSNNSNNKPTCICHLNYEDHTKHTNESQHQESTSMNPALEAALISAQLIDSYLFPGSTNNQQHSTNAITAASNSIPPMSKPIIPIVHETSKDNSNHLNVSNNNESAGYSIDKPTEAKQNMIVNAVPVYPSHLFSKSSRYILRTQLSKHIELLMKTYQLANSVQIQIKHKTRCKLKILNKRKLISDTQMLINQIQQSRLSNVAIVCSNSELMNQWKQNIYQLAIANKCKQIVQQEEIVLYDRRKSNHTNKRRLMDSTNNLHDNNKSNNNGSKDEKLNDTQIENTNNIVRCDSGSLAGNKKIRLQEPKNQISVALPAIVDAIIPIKPEFPPATKLPTYRLIKGTGNRFSQKEMKLLSHALQVYYSNNNIDKSEYPVHSYLYFIQSNYLPTKTIQQIKTKIYSLNKQTTHKPNHNSQNNSSNNNNTTSNTSNKKQIAFDIAEISEMVHENNNNPSR